MLPNLFQLWSCGHRHRPEEGTEWVELGDCRPTWLIVEYNPDDPHPVARKGELGLERGDFSLHVRDSQGIYLPAVGTPHPRAIRHAMLHSTRLMMYDERLDRWMPMCKPNSINIQDFLLDLARELYQVVVDAGSDPTMLDARKAEEELQRRAVKFHLDDAPWVFEPGHIWSYNFGQAWLMVLIEQGGKHARR